jgi:hypothetical protein
MQEITGNLFELEADAICILTNGYVNTDGANTMGKGCAGDAKARWPGIQLVMGTRIKRHGNHVFLLTDKSEIGEWTIHTPGGWKNHTCNSAVISFPTKPDFCRTGELLPYYRSNINRHWKGDRVILQERPEDLIWPGWMANSDLRLIEQSAEELLGLTQAFEFESILIPRPGCGAGGLNWDDVRPVLNDTLDDRFYAVTFG